MGSGAMPRMAPDPGEGLDEHLLRHAVIRDAARPGNNHENGDYRMDFRAATIGASSNEKAHATRHEIGGQEKMPACDRRARGPVALSSKSLFL